MKADKGVSWLFLPADSHRRAQMAAHLLLYFLDYETRMQEDRGLCRFVKRLRSKNQCVMVCVAPQKAL